ncbi:MAG: DUF354 domain-containing protein [Desulfobacteraceae bacterium]|nr:DUF354 domain-containing protein [Desulfobacteraceae bacterium]
MNILFDIGHPAHVHLFKNLIKHLKKNNNVIVVSRDKDIVEQLLDHYKINHYSISKPRKNIFGMVKEMLKRDYEIYKLHKKFKFDIAIGTSVSIGHLSMVSKIKSYNFNEDDDSAIPLYGLASYPFSTKIINPSCIKYARWKRKRIHYNSYHELAYLHPDNFKPDIKILDKYQLKANEYIIIRKSALNAHHDFNAKGIEKDNLWTEIEKITNNIPKIISEENKKTYQIQPWDMHHILSFAKMIISDSLSMSVEAAVLGVPSVQYNSFVGRCSVLNELENKYQLTYGFNSLDSHSHEKMINIIKELLDNPNLKDEWERKKERMLLDKINLNNWMVNFFKLLEYTK